MKKSLSVVSLLLAIVMIALCCAACGDDKKSEESADNGTVSIIGKWTTDIDFDKYMSALDASAGGGMSQMYELLKDAFAGVTLKVYLTFNDDGTVVLMGDKDSVEAAAAKIKSGMTDVLSAMGLPQDQIDSAVGSMDISSLADGVTNKYEIDGSKLYMYDPEEQKDENNYVEFELSASALKFTKAVGDNGMITDGIMPIVLTKVN